MADRQALIWARVHGLTLRLITAPAVVAVALLLGTTFVAALYPGQASIDSNSQLHQILIGRLNDWHPPGLTRLWQVFLLEWSGPPVAPLFIFNCCCYWTGLALIGLAQQRVGNAIAALVCVAVGVAPLSLTLMSRVTKDADLAAVLILAIGLLLTARDQRRGMARAMTLGAACTCLAYALHVRHNAVFIASPLFAMLIALIRPGLARRPLLLLGACLTAGVLLIPVVSFDNHHLLGAADAQPINSLRLFDLAGIANQLGDASVLGQDSRVTIAEVHRCYTPTFWDQLAPWGRCSDFAARAGVRFADQTGQVPFRFNDGTLARAWTDAIRRHPLAYVEHRLAHFNRTTYAFGPLTKAVGFPSPLEDHVNGRYRGSRLLYLFRYGAPFTPAWQMVLAVVLSPFLLLAAHRGASTAGDVALYLCVGGLAYAGSFLIVGVATDPRYFLISSTTITLAAVLACGDPTFRRLVRTRRVAAGIAVGALAVFTAAQIASRYQDRGLSTVAWAAP